MKSTGLLLTFLLAIIPPLVAQSGAPADPAAKPAEDHPTKLSPGIAQLLTEQLPRYAQPAPAKPAAAENSDVLELPKVTITQKKRPRLGDEVMLTTKAFNEKLAKEKLSSFDRNFLNKYTLPLFGSSAALRARDEYEREKREQLANEVFALAKVAEQIDPAQAKALRDAATKP